MLLVRSEISRCLRTVVEVSSPSSFRFCKGREHVVGFHARLRYSAAFTPAARWVYCVGSEIGSYVLLNYAGGNVGQSPIATPYEWPQLLSLKEVVNSDRTFLSIFLSIKVLNFSR